MFRLDLADGWFFSVGITRPRERFFAVGISVPEFMAWWDVAWSVLVSSIVGVFLYSFIFVPMVQR